MKWSVFDMKWSAFGMKWSAFDMKWSALEFFWCISGRIRRIWWNMRCVWRQTRCDEKKMKERLAWNCRVSVNDMERQIKTSRSFRVSRKRWGGQKNKLSVFFEKNFDTNDLNHLNHLIKTFFLQNNYKKVNRAAGVSSLGRRFVVYRLDYCKFTGIIDIVILWPNRRRTWEKTAQIAVSELLPFGRLPESELRKPRQFSLVDIKLWLTTDSMNHERLKRAS